MTNLENRRKANTKYYSKEKNKEQKRAYAREYAKRPEVIARRKAYYYTLKGNDYYKKYYKKPGVKEKMRAYAKAYNKRPKIKVARHEWYIQKLINDNETDKRRIRGTGSPRNFRTTV